MHMASMLLENNLTVTVEGLFVTEMGQNYTSVILIT